MKKFIAMMLVLVIALSLVACGDPSTAIVGVWKSTNYSCTFKADGTGEVTVGKGVTSSCTWTYDEAAGVWNVNYGDGKGVASLKTGDDGKSVLVWQESEYNRVG